MRTIFFLLLFILSTIIGVAKAETEPTSIDHPSAESCAGFMLGQWISHSPTRTVTEQWSMAKPGLAQGKREVMEQGKDKEETRIEIKSTRFAPIGDVWSSKQSKATGEVETECGNGSRKTTFTFRVNDGSEPQHMMYKQTDPNKLTLSIEKIHDGKTITQEIEFKREQSN